MRVYKTTGDVNHDLRIIAGEMLNRETSTYYWHKGIKALVGGGDDADVTPADYKDYPKVIVGDVKHIIKPSSGVIFVSSTNMSRFIDDLILVIETMEKDMTDDGVNVLGQYHSVSVGYHTNVKVKPVVSGTKTQQKIHQTKKWVKRLIVSNNYKNYQARFIWNIKDVSSAVDEIINANCITSVLCSIFYDTSDILNIPDNTIIFGATQQIYRGTNNIVKDQTDSVTISTQGFPLICQLYSTSIGYYMYDFGKPVYKATFEQLEFVPVYDKANRAHSSEICTKCHHVLFGDVYGMMINATKCHAYCPICAHTDGVVSNIGTTYTNIVRVAWPRTIADMIERESCAVIRDIMHEIQRGIERKEISIAGRTIKYVIIGDKYVGVNNMARYTYTELVHHADFVNRKVCSITIS